MPVVPEDDKLPPLNIVSLREIIDTAPDPGQTLLGNRFLCRGGAMLFIGPSGIGKSSASIREDILWSIGRPAFGIAPRGPLRLLVIQSGRRRW